MLHDAAKMGDVEIPVFCYEPKLGDPVGACRMCLVEIEGMPKLQTACSTPVRDGMVVYTQTDRVKEAQEAVVEFLLVNHPLDCPVCDKGGECPLQDIAMGWGPGKSRFTDPKRHFQKPLELSPLVAIDRERCILCYRCVRFSQEVAEDEQLQLLERGDKSFVGTFDERPYIAPFHGNIIELCPVGALTSYTYRFRARPWDIEDAGSICTLCPSQCNVKFTVRDERVLRVLARDNAEVDDGWLCDKGRFAFQMFNSTGADHAADGPRRRREPQRDQLGRGGHSGRERPPERRRARRRWSAAAPRTRRGGWSSASCAASLRPTSTARRARSSPACSASSRAPSSAPRIADLDHADAILVIGTDPLHEMPILDLRIRKAVRRARAKLIVASERPTALDGGATEAIRYAPGEAAASCERSPARSARTATTRRAHSRRRPRRSPSAARGPRPGDRLGRAALARARCGRGPSRLRAGARDAQADRTGPARGPGGVERPRPARGRLPARRSAGAGAGWRGRGSAGIKDGLASNELGALLLVNADPVRTHPDSEGWRKALGGSFVVSIASFEDESTRLATS